MDIYWIFEYIKVFGGYIFLMFIWPAVIFEKYLINKSKIYQFSFCVTVQVVLINTVVLMMGIFHILNGKVIVCLFYGIFLLSVGIRIKMIWNHRGVDGDGKQEKLLWHVKNGIRKKFVSLKNDIRLKGWEYLFLFIIVIFGMIYFSYGAFQVRCYGQTDIVVHHQWANGLVKGKVFTGGVYPEAMHCFIYCLHTLFGIRIYSIMMFLQGIHIMVFFLAAYALLREVFHWRWSPIFVLALYLTININNYGYQYSIYRLQMTLPLEFGLYTQFLCALYLIRYLKYADCVKHKESFSKCYWDENLLLFIMSLAASIAIHYQTTIMAFILCAAVALVFFKKVVFPRYLIPLTISVICGCIIAGTPMASAIASGIPFNDSINWGLKSISSNIDNSNQEDEQESTFEEIEDLVFEKKPLELSAEDMKVVENLPDIGQKLMITIIKTEYFIKEIFQSGYKGMYGEKGGRWIFAVTVIVIAICIAGKHFSLKNIRKICGGYFPIILASIVSMVIYMAYESPDLGLPVLITGNRYNSSAHMIVLAVMIMPMDMIFSTLTFFGKNFILQVASVFFTIGIYVFANLFGVYHEYLHYSLTRYDSAVRVTDSIIEEFPRDSYIIISPYEELCQVDLYGDHKDLFDFIEECNKESYSLPAEYVFIYVEKKPIVYRQTYYFSGPAWLGKSNASKIRFTEISKEEAKKDMSGFTHKIGYREGRTILESKAYEWSQNFLQRYPSVMKVYYEDEEFVCYYFEQDVDVPYNLAGDRK